MAFQDEAFLTSKDNFSITFLKNRGKGDSLGTPTCPKTVFGGRHTHC